MFVGVTTVYKLGLDAVFFNPTIVQFYGLIAFDVLFKAISFLGLMI